MSDITAEEAVAAADRIDKRLERLSEKMKVIDAYLERLRESHDALLTAAQELVEEFTCSCENYYLDRDRDDPRCDYHQRDHVLTPLRAAVAHAKEL